MFHASQLENRLKLISVQVNRDLFIGSANKKTDLERSSSWSADAVEHARLKARYKKIDNEKYVPEFKHLRVCSNKGTLPFVSEGANGKFARAGNCQEHVGLSLYYLSHHASLWRLVEVVTFEECFDHIFLKVTGTDGKKFYLDTWANKIFTAPLTEHLLEISNIIVSGMEETLRLASDPDEIDALKEDLQACSQTIEKQGAPTISLEMKFKPENAENYITQFDEYYQSLLKETYPHSP